MNAERLRRAGIDYDAGLSRFMGDRELYELVLAAFLDDRALERARRAHDMGDRAALMACAHELKGSSGNTDMTELCRASTELVACLRRDCADAELDERFRCFETAYLAARVGIGEAVEGAP